MTIEQIREGAPIGASHYLIYDGALHYFKKSGVHMHQYLGSGFNGNPFSCAAFFKFKPL